MVPRLVILVSLICGVPASGQPDPGQLLAQGSSLAREIDNAERRSRALSVLVSAYAPHGPERALELAREIPEGDLRDAALVKVAGALASADLDAALAIAESLTDRFYQPFRSQALGAIAATVALQDPRRAEDLADRIAAAAARDRALADVALGVARVEPKRAARVASRAASPEAVVRAITRLIPVLAETEPGAAETAMVLASRKLDEVPDLARWQLLSDLVQVGASVDPERAARYAEAIGDQEALAYALAAVGAVFAAAEQSDARARGKALFERAVEIVAQLSPVRRISGLARLSAVAKGFDPGLADHLTAQVDGAVLRVADEEERDAALLAVASHEGPVHLQRALNAAQRIQDPLLAARGYRLIAEAIVGDSSEGAQQALQSGLARAKEITDDRLREPAIARLCAAWARLSLPDALELMKGSLGPEGQVAAISAVLDTLARQPSPN